MYGRRAQACPSSLLPMRLVLKLTLLCLWAFIMLGVGTASGVYAFFALWPVSDMEGGTVGGGTVIQKILSVAGAALGMGGFVFLLHKAVRMEDASAKNKDVIVDYSERD